MQFTPCSDGRIFSNQHEFTGNFLLSSCMHKFIFHPYLGYFLVDKRKDWLSFCPVKVLSALPDLLFVSGDKDWFRKMGF